MPADVRFLLSRLKGWRARLENLAVVLLGLALVILPGILDTGREPRVSFERASLPPLRIDVNRAEWYDWALLEGIGEARARAIVEYRRAHGPFRGPEDLRRIPGLPAGWVERALPHLDFGGGGERRATTGPTMSSGD